MELARNNRHDLNGARTMQVGQTIGWTSFLTQITGSLRYTKTFGSASSWEDALQRLAIGEATPADVETCLGRPTVQTIEVTLPDSIPEASWQYRTRTRNWLFGGSRLRVVTVNFRDRVVSGIKVIETR
jgi:hypothetical protein